MCRHSSIGRARRRQRRGREFEARCLLHTNCSTSGEVTRPSTSTDGFDPRAVHQHVVANQLSATWHQRDKFLWGVSLAGRKHLIVDQKIAGSTPARLAILVWLAQRQNGALTRRWAGVQSSHQTPSAPDGKRQTSRAQTSRLLSSNLREHTRIATLTGTGIPRPLKPDGFCVRIAGVAPYPCSSMDRAPDFYSGG